MWSLVLDRPACDPRDLTPALESAALAQDLDFRTRLLIRDSVVQLRTLWGERRFQSWLSGSLAGDRISKILDEELGPCGFPFLGQQIMETTRAETIAQYLRELGSQLRRPATIYIGGSAALIVRDLLSRRTQDIDVVDELPEEIRTAHKVLENLGQRYRLMLTHFQSRYLPDGWQQRAFYLDAYSPLRVYLVEPYDIFVGKLFSAREKDRDDLRALVPQLDKETMERRFRETTARLQAEDHLKKQAETNWYILFGETLPQ